MSKEHNEALEKSIDTLIDEVFTEPEEPVEGEEVEKSIDIAGDSKTTADAVVNKAPKGQKDEARGAGRPKQISDVPQNDLDGARAKDYDSAISEPGKEKDQDEADQVKESNQIKAKGGNDAGKPKKAPFKKSEDSEEGWTEESWAEYQELKKAKDEAEAEELKKAEEEKTENLIKSVVKKTAEKYEDKIESLQKSLDEQTALVKAMAKKPQASKSITNIEALEKGEGEEPNKEGEYFTKSEVLDAAEELVKAGKLEMDHVIELENNGFIFDPRAKKVLEDFMQKRK